MSATDKNKTPFLTTRQKIRRETLGMGLAEFSSAVFSIGTVAVLEDLSPKLTKATTKFLARYIFVPYLDYAENTLGYVCRLKECQPDQTKSREERAENLARATMLFVPAFVTSWAAKIATRKLTNKFLKVEDHAPPQSRKWWELHKMMSGKDWTVIGLDEGVHLGAIWLVNAGVPDISDGMLRTTQRIFEKAGVPKEKAKDMASMLVIWELPNVMGWLAGVGGVIHHHTHSVDAHIEKMVRNGLSDITPHRH